VPYTARTTASSRDEGIASSETDRLHLADVLSAVLSLGPTACLDLDALGDVALAIEPTGPGANRSGI